MLKKFAIATTLSLLSIGMVVNTTQAQSLGDGDIDSIINGLTSNDNTTITTTTTTTTSEEIVPVSSTVETTTTTEDIMVEPEEDSSAEEVSINTDGGIVEDVMVEPETTTEPVVESSYNEEKPQVVTPKSTKYYKKLSAAGMDFMTLILISGMLSTFIAGFLLFIKMRKSRK